MPIEYDPDAITWRSPTFPTPRHERVHDLLRRLVSEGTANFFADAFDIANQKPAYRTTTHIVGHLIREVECNLLKVLATLPGARKHLAENPPKKDAGHASKIDAILHALEMQSDGVASAWHSFVSDDGW